MLLAASTTHAVAYLWLQCTYLETGRTIRLEPAYVYWATDHVISIHYGEDSSHSTWSWIPILNALQSMQAAPNVHMHCKDFKLSFPSMHSVQRSQEKIQPESLYPPKRNGLSHSYEPTAAIPANYLKF